MYRTADYQQHETLKAAKSHIRTISIGVSSDNLHIVRMIWKSKTIGEGYSDIWLPYEPVKRIVRKPTAEIIVFPKHRTIRDGLILEIRKAA